MTYLSGAIVLSAQYYIVLPVPLTALFVDMIQMLTHS